jgi:hypothetical protein
MLACQGLAGRAVISWELRALGACSREGGPGIMMGVGRNLPIWALEISYKQTKSQSHNFHC